ncbi:unnamed protein product [Prorocentrum cordatum]|nr:unnamed protein product [Polarella glacialis]
MEDAENRDVEYEDQDVDGDGAKGESTAHEGVEGEPDGLEDEGVTGDFSRDMLTYSDAGRRRRLRLARAQQPDGDLPPARGAAGAGARPAPAAEADVGEVGPGPAEQHEGEIQPLAVATASRPEPVPVLGHADRRRDGALIPLISSPTSHPPMQLTIAKDSRPVPVPAPGHADGAAWCGASIAPRWLPRLRIASDAQRPGTSTPPRSTLTPCRRPVHNRPREDRRVRWPRRPGEAAAAHLKRLKVEGGYYFTAAWHSWRGRVGQEKGETRSRVKFDPSCWKSDMIERFLGEMARGRYVVGTWPRNAGAHVDWGREDALHQEFQRKRGAAKGEGRGVGPARSSGHTEN